MSSLIYDLSVIITFIISGSIFLFGAFKKLPSDIQKLFNSFFPWSYWIPFTIGVFMLLNAANHGYELIT